MAIIDIFLVCGLSLFSYVDGIFDPWGDWFSNASVVFSEKRDNIAFMFLYG